MPPHFVELKKEIAASYPNFQERVTKAWTSLLAELAEETDLIAKEGTSVRLLLLFVIRVSALISICTPQIIPQVQFSEIASLKPEVVDTIKRRGCVVIKDVVDDSEAAGWKSSLEKYIKENPTVPGFPAEDKQFFQLYWTRPQVQARAHPNVLATSTWLNQMYHVKGNTTLEGVDLSTPLTYADRFRIRHPGVQWDVHPPHVDGGSIERWQDETFRTCFADILAGDFQKHDPYDLEGRVNARSSLYGRPGQSTVLRTFQGWLALSETAPTEGTLKVFPDVLLSNAYIILRPFFTAKSTPVTSNPLDAENWEYNISTSDFPGIFPRDGGFTGPRPNPNSHPHMRLDETMTSVPKVKPGDMVFWHCDVVHSVEQEHTGKGDSAVMYIPAVPYTPQNAAYVQKQKDTFLASVPPPDFPKHEGEATYAGGGRETDVVSAVGRVAMGLPIAVA
ncbi:hypothetical protein JAAARDRAFT_128012 [Jaapia argillacea MUCL 33604]|uniref:DUF1479-domain-containing protein n=1 Tax=Jaapia argillacea MUCL 33604 TaxID=933084 RepID=A0A067Q6Z1_9AGAM|nr:hypothetical protein JAAARDRAFT_128012 [Jaapia argillacea MUCL 33604]